MPAAAEVAAYRITAEALANVAKRSGARHVDVRLRFGGRSSGPPTRSRGAGMTDEMTALVAAHHPMFQAGIAALVDALPQARVVGNPSEGDENRQDGAGGAARRRTHRSAHAGANGLKAIRSLAADRPSAACLVLTMVENDDTVAATLPGRRTALRAQGCDARGDHACAGGGRPRRGHPRCPWGPECWRGSLRGPSG